MQSISSGGDWTSNGSPRIPRYSGDLVERVPRRSRQGSSSSSRGVTEVDVWPVADPRPRRPVRGPGRGPDSGTPPDATPRVVVSRGGRLPRGEPGTGRDARLQSVDAEGAPVGAVEVPGHQVPAAAGVDEAVGLDRTAGRGAVVGAVVEAQPLVVAAGGGERGQHVGVDRRAGAGGRGTVTTAARRRGGAAATGRTCSSLASARSEVSSIPATVPARRCAARRRRRRPRRRRAAAAAAPRRRPAGSRRRRPGWRAPGSRGRAACRRRGGRCARSTSSRSARSAPVQSRRACSRDSRRSSRAEVSSMCPSLPAN